MDINFYYVKNEYIDFLKNYEKTHRGFTCVPNTQYSLNEKFLYGAVFENNGICYFVPVSSKIKNADNNIVIKTGKKDINSVATLRFAYMIPVPQECLIMLNINSINKYSRKQLIREELAFCRKNIHKIKLQAQKTFTAVTNSKNKKLINNSCDFKLLETAYIIYCKNNSINLPDKLN